MPFALETYSKDAHARALRPGLRLDPMDGHGAQISDEDTDAVIRAVLSEGAGSAAVPRGPTRRRALPAIAPQDEYATARRRRRTRTVRSETSKPAAEALPESERPELAASNMQAEYAIYAEVPDVPGTEPEREARTGDRRWLRPAIIGAFVAAAILRPWLVLLPLFLGFWAVTLFVAFLGDGSFGEGFGRIYRWMKERNPARAERLRARMDGLAMRVDDLIDRVPGGFLDALALPDFSDAALDPQIGEGRPDPFTRLRG